MEVQDMLKTLYKDRHDSAIYAHETDYIDAMHSKIIFSGRKPNLSEIQAIKKLYKLYINRKVEQQGDI